MILNKINRPKPERCIETECPEGHAYGRESASGPVKSQSSPRMATLCTVLRRIS